MKIKKKYFHDNVCLIELPEYKDSRGLFMEIFHEKKMKILFKFSNFVQLNYAKSKQNVLRGLHFQKNKTSQGKLIRVLNGSVFDVIVNLDKKSKYFKKTISFHLNAKNQLLWVPRKYAHGYLSLEKNTEIEYFCDNFYDKNSERTLLWDDKNLSIKWQLKKKPIISKKDRNGATLKEVISNL